MAAVSNTKFKFAALAVIGLALVFTPITVNGKELCVDPNDDAEALVNGANDVVVVRQASGELRSTPLHVGKQTNEQN